MNDVTPSLQREIKQTKPFASPAVEAVLGVLRTADALRNLSDELLGPYGISLQQYNVLRILRGAKEGLPTLEVGARMIEKSPGITRLLDRIEAKGLVRRERSEEDRRLVVCSITRRGLDLLAELDDPIVRLDEEALAGLSRADQRTLVGLLDRIRERARR